MTNTFNNKDRKQKRLEKECHMSQVAQVAMVVKVVAMEAIAVEMENIKVLIIKTMGIIEEEIMEAMVIMIMLGDLESMVIMAMVNLHLISIKINRKIRNKLDLQSISLWLYLT